MAPYVFLLFIPLLLLVPSYFFLLKKKSALQNQQLPPGPPTLPIIGNLHQLGALPHQTLCKLSKKYGPVMLLRYGRIPTAIISSAEAAREVLKTHDLACCSRPRLIGSARLTYNNVDVAFAPYGSYWREMKKLSVLELFSLKRVQSFRCTREEEVAVLISSISQSSKSAIPVQLDTKVYALAASIVFRMAFGKSFGSTGFDDNTVHKLVHEAESILGYFSAEECFLSYVGWMIDRLTGYHAKLERVFLQLDTFFDQLINDHLKPGRTKEQEDIIDVLLKIEREQHKSGAAAWFTKNNIKALLLNIFLGGIDTSAITVTWAMAELVRNPRVMKKAQDEIRKAVGRKGRVTEDDINELQYLKMVVKETLRLHTVVPLLIPREAMSNFVINGFHIHPKTLLQVNVWAISRDPKYWKNPEEFYPERFADSSTDFKGQHFELLPFGSGRRVCPGLNLGTAMVELTLSNLLYSFDWKLPNGMREEDLNMEEAVGASLTVTKKMPLMLVPVKYLQSAPED